MAFFLLFMCKNLQSYRSFVLVLQMPSCFHLNFDNLFWCCLCCYRIAILFELCTSCRCDSCFLINISHLEFSLFNFRYILNMYPLYIYNHRIPTSKRSLIFQFLKGLKFYGDPFKSPPQGPGDSLLWKSRELEASSTQYILARFTNTILYNASILYFAILNYITLKK